MLLPALRDAATDPTLRGAPREVLLLLHAGLDLVDYRPVKAWVLASAIGCRPQTAARALRRLVEEGYLDAGPITTRNVGTYRLYATRGGQSGSKRHHPWLGELPRAG